MTSKVDVDELARLREDKGWTYARIAEHFGMSKGWVAWHCLVHGIEKPGARNRSGGTKPGTVEKRGKFLVRRYSEAEDAQLLALESKRLTYNAIARELGRKPNSVRGRLATLARREARAEA